MFTQSTQKWQIDQICLSLVVGAVTRIPWMTRSSQRPVRPGWRRGQADWSAAPRTWSCLHILAPIRLRPHTPHLSAHLRMIPWHVRHVFPCGDSELCQNRSSATVNSWPCVGGKGLVTSFISPHSRQEKQPGYKNLSAPALSTNTDTSTGFEDTRLISYP